jgi:hypothetical protein
MREGNRYDGVTGGAGRTKSGTPRWGQNARTEPITRMSVVAKMNCQPTTAR